MKRLLRWGGSLAMGMGLGCGGGGSTATAPPADAGSDVDAVDAGSIRDGGALPRSDAASVSQSVTFTYRPQWDGVTKVEVVGGFAQSTDWSTTASLLTLVNDGSGSFTGSTSLPVGQYLYVFRVTGDAAAADPTKFVRYTLDPLNTAFAACPAQSPTYNKVDANPCSEIAVPGRSPLASVNVTGSLTVDGNAANGWLVVLEREEPKSHHFFVNRVTVSSTGAFSLTGSAGHYRLQVLYPTYLSEKDVNRSPVALNALRRAISDSFTLGASDVTVTAPDLAFHVYGQFSPTGDAGATLPTPFAFEDGVPARLDVFGSQGDGGTVEIGDPWFVSPLTRDGGDVFDGSFNTKQALQASVVAGRQYMWGSEEPFDASVGWTKQTMVFPIAWR